ncbi:hypothetical protein AB8Z38_32015 [Bradyrhizobium sp. LLZ17]|uniref:Uncharacterized protein n=1 Tax=Bradyrhizobium sp. LLZ17 TaxID=3239388 RepID=A0AB39XI43_9BRAD
MLLISLIGAATAEGGGIYALGSFVRAARLIIDIPYASNAELAGRGAGLSVRPAHRRAVSSDAGPP